MLELCLDDFMAKLHRDVTIKVEIGLSYVVKDLEYVEHNIDLIANGQDGLYRKYFKDEIALPSTSSSDYEKLFDS